jgi:hypothetical protein
MQINQYINRSFRTLGYDMNSYSKVEQKIMTIIIITASLQKISAVCFILSVRGIHAMTTG